MLSIDGSLSFGAPAVLNTNATSDSGDDGYAQVTTDGAGNWVAVWHSLDSLEGTIGTDRDILISRSVDGGATWTAPAALNTNAASDTGSDSVPQVTTDGAGNWVAVWAGQHSAPYDFDILVSRSNNSGVTWTDPVPLNSNAGSDSGHDRYPQLTTDRGGSWVAVWESTDSLGGSIGTDVDLLVSYSTDAGVTWTAPVPLNSNAGSDSGNDRAAQITSDGAGNWVVVWESDDSLGGTIGTDVDLFVSRSTNAGAAWTALAPLNSTAGLDSEPDSGPQVTTDEAGNWVAVWYSWNNLGGSGNDYDILMSHSADAGATWTAAAQLNNNAASDSEHDWSPQIATDGAGDWVAVWESLSTDWDILVSHSVDGGVTWSAPAPLNSNSGSDSGDDRSSQITTDGAGNWVAVWHSDDSLGGMIGDDQDILFATYSEPPTEIRGTKWEDLDADGVWDAGEPGLAGVMIYLDLNRNGLLDDGEPSAATAEDDPLTVGTDETGTYAFSPLDAGRYVVSEVVPAGYAQTHPNVPDTPPGGLAHTVTYRAPNVGMTDVAGSSGISFSPDGRHLYVTCKHMPTGSMAVLVLARDDATGSLSLSQLVKGADIGLPTVESANEVLISPDGAHVYVAALSSTSTGGEVLAAFNRDAVTGTISFIHELQDGVDADKLDNVLELAVTPDGDHIYAVSTEENALSVFGRDALTGRLTQIQTVTNPYASDVVVSPDGRFVYTTSRNNSLIRVFERDVAAGTVTEIGTVHGDTEDLELYFPTYLAMSPDGSHLYTTSDVGRNLAVLQLDPVSGMATVVQNVKNTIWTHGLDFPKELVVSPDGSRVYVTAYSGNSVATFIRDQDTGKLRELQIVRQGDPGVDCLTYVGTITISPDGQHIYTSAPYPDFNVTLFTRDTLRGQVVDVGPGDTQVADFGNQSLHGEIGGTKWDDLDGDGIRDEGEPGFPGVTIYLDLDEDGRLDDGEPTTMTGDDDPATQGIDEAGTYIFTDVVPGDYAVREVVPDGQAGTHPSSPDNGTGRLTYAGYLRDGADGADGLDGVQEIAVSPDGRHVYTVSSGDRCFSVFSRNMVTGELQFVEMHSPYLWVTSITVSPDGSHVYATAAQNGQLFVASRDSTTGRLTWIQTVRDGVGGVDYFGWPMDSVVSPDGKHVYVATWDDGLQIFSRDPSTGLLTYVSPSVLPGRPRYASGVSISPDGMHVYVTSDNGHSLGVYTRNLSTGRLTVIQSFADAAVYGLSLASSVEVSPDGRHVYTTGTASDAVGIFARDIATGLLTLVEVLRDGVWDMDGIASPYCLTFDPTGRYVYATGNGDHAVTVFRRDTLTGRLSVLEILKDGVDVPDGLGYPHGVAVSPDGSHLYVAGGGDDAVVVFSRDRTSHLVSLEPHELVEGIDFGSREVHTLHGTKWHDLDADSVWDAGEPGLAGVTIYLDLNENGEFDDGEPMAITSVDDPGTTGTDETGSYQFTGLAPGAYTVAEVTPDGFRQTYPLAYPNPTGDLTELQIVEDEYNADGLNGVRDVTLSPDGTSAYAVGYLEDELAVFSRDPQTGRLTFVEVERDGTGGVDGLDDPISVVVSPDGKHVYAAGVLDHGIAVFSRNAATSELAFVETVKNGMAGVTNLVAPNDLAFSPDGTQLYVTANGSDALTVFSRDSATGQLTQLESQIDGSGGIDGLVGPISVTVSLDGAHVYVSSGEDALVAFQRDSVDGSLSYLATTWGGTGGVDGLDGLFAIALSDDGENLYSVGNHAHALVVFGRDPATGILTHLETHRDSDPGVDGLLGPWALDVSPDGLHVYVAGTYDNAVSVFDRDIATGLLSYASVTRTTTGLGWLHGVESVVVSPDGQFVYAGEYDVDDLTVMHRAQGIPAPSVHVVTLGGGEIVDGLDFGNVSTSGEIRGVKWNDLDGDGQQDGDETGSGEVTVYLDLNNNGQLDSGEPSQLTAGDGGYAFTGLEPGTYTVSEIVPADSTQTWPDPAEGGIERVSAKSDGTSSNSDSLFPSLSADGRYVAFVSAASDLLPGDMAGFADIYLQNRQTGLHQRVTILAGGMEPNGHSLYPAISDDGQIIAFTSEATNLVASGDTNGMQDVFVVDLSTGVFERISVHSDGTEANGTSYAPSISGDGRYVTFASDATNLVTGDTNDVRDVFVYDRQFKTTTRVSVDGTGNQVTGASDEPQISDDGHFVVFWSGAEDLVPGDTNGFYDVFVHELTTGTIERVSVARDGSQIDGGVSYFPAISGDGRYIAFVTTAYDVVPGDFNAVPDVFVRDRLTGTTEWITRGMSSLPTNGGSYAPEFSDDGRYVAFFSAATNLVPDDTNGQIDLFVYDRQAASTRRASIAADGTEALVAPYWLSGLAISDDGMSVAFNSLDTNLVSGDTGGFYDVYVASANARLPGTHAVALMAGGLVDEIDFGNRLTPVNTPPTVSLTPTLTTLPENTDTSSRIKLADIVVTDDGLGTNVLSLAGADAAMFEILGSELFLVAGAALDFETNPQLDVTVEVDDATIAGTPDGTAVLAITVTNVTEWIYLSGNAAANDVIVVEPGIVGSSLHRVTVNGVLATYDPALCDAIHIDGLGGTDSIVIHGTSQDETATLTPGSADVLGQTYQIHAANIETITVDAGTGDDSVTMTGSAGSNRLYSYTGYSRLIDSTRTYSYRANGFDEVDINAPGSTNNYAFLYDSPQGDTLEADPTEVILTRGIGTPEATTTTATGFRRTYAYATYGGSDTATLTGAATTANRLYDYPDYSILTESSSSFYFYARGFDTVTASSPSTAITYAYLYDSTGTDALTADPATVAMDRAAPWSDTTASGFKRFYAYSNRGGADTATLTGSASGGNIYRAYPTYSTLTNTAGSFYQYVRGFHFVTASGSSTDGSSDRAYLYDSSGADTLLGHDNSAILRDTAATTYQLEAVYFDMVYARSSDGVKNDTIDVDDSLAYNLIRYGTW